MTLRRSAGYWAIAGLAVPLVVLLLTELQGGAFAWPRLAFVSWPSSLMMMALEGHKGGIFTLFGLLIFVVSVAINVALYSAVGVFVGLISRLLR